MEYFLGKVTQQAMNYAIRSGVTLTASFAIKQSSKLLANAPKSRVTDEIYELQQRLHHKIRIVSPAIDMIELIAARGNTSLESAVSLTRELRVSIQKLGQRIARAATASEQSKAGSARSRATAEAANESEYKLIVYEIKNLLSRIEDAIPLINLALTTSGAKLSTQLPPTVSPSRLLQASTFLTAGDTQYTLSPHKVAQIGPTFTLTVYMLFAGHDRPETEEDIRNTTWKEVIHKAKVKLRRVPLDVVLSTGSGSTALQSHEILSSPQTPNPNDTPGQLRGEARVDEFAYQLMIVEDLDDDRFHDFDEDDSKPQAFDDINMAGIREMVPVHEISKIFYADTSKVLNIGMDAESNHPVLLLRRDVDAVPPRRMMDAEEEEDLPDHHSTHGSQLVNEQQQTDRDHTDRTRDPWRLPPSLDPEWIAFEVYNEAEVSDSDNEQDEEAVAKVATSVPPNTVDESSQISVEMSSLQISPPSTRTASTMALNTDVVQQPAIPPIKTSLSMLELLLRLTSLQQFQQQSHLAIPDELLNFFLEESASTGAGGDENHRQAVRADARRKVGWDPYDESPLKRRGEDYQYGQYAFSESPQLSRYQQQGQHTSMSSPGARYSIDSPLGRSSRSIRGGMGRISSPSSLQEQQQQAVIIAQEGTVTSQSSSPLNGISQSQPASRADWLRRSTNTHNRSSPLRPTMAHNDEGLGTSPGSVPTQTPQKDASSG